MSIDWESRYQSGDTPWDKGAPHPVLPLLLARIPLSGRVLVPGCGSGADVRALAAADPSAKVLGLDCAPSALALARSHPVVGGEEYVLGDLFDLPPEMQGAFDAVWEHTCFCAIDPTQRGDYAKAIAGVLRSGGVFAGVFLLNPDLGPEEGGPPFGVERGELDRWFDAAFELTHSGPVAATYLGREGREELRIYRKR